MTAVLAHDPDDTVREVLELRQASSNTAVAKYNAVLAGAFPDQRIYGLLNYYGAHTGRWTSAGFNVHNLPREDSNDALAAIDAIRSGDLEQVRAFGPPLEVIASLARGLVVAPPNRLLLAGDFSTIEPRVASWFAEETWKLDNFRDFDETGDPLLDAHRVVGARMRGQPVDPTDDEARQHGKTVHMAFNYGGSVRVWREHVPNDPAQRRGDQERRRSDKFRQLHPAQTRFMYDLDKQALRCVRYRAAGAAQAPQLRDGRRHADPAPAERASAVLSARAHQARQIRQERRRLPQPCQKPRRRDVVRRLARALWCRRPRAICWSMRCSISTPPASTSSCTCTMRSSPRSTPPTSSTTASDSRPACLQAPAWAEGLPLAAKVRVGPRYIKTDAPIEIKADTIVEGGASIVATEVAPIQPQDGCFGDTEALANSDFHTTEPPGGSGFEHNLDHAENDDSDERVEAHICAQCHLNPPDGSERLSAYNDEWLHPHCEEAFIRARMAEEGLPWEMPTAAERRPTAAFGEAPPPPLPPRQISGGGAHDERGTGARPGPTTATKMMRGEGMVQKPRPHVIPMPRSTMANRSTTPSCDIAATISLTYLITRLPTERCFTIRAATS